MERGVHHRGRCNKKVPVGVVLLLCMFIPSLALQQPSDTCPYDDYLTEEGICCNKCLPGTKLAEICHAVGQRSTCVLCPVGQFSDQINYSPNCRSCKRCRASKHEVEVSKCERKKNTICRCEDGYYKFDIDSVTSECRKCKQCGPDEKQTHKCTPESNTVCDCTENYYRVKNKCEPCKNCTAECVHLCASVPPRGTKSPDPGNQYLINIITGVVAVALLLSILVFVTTHIATKWFTKKKLLQSSSQSSDISPDSCEKTYIDIEEPFIITDKAAPPNSMSAHEPSNLPDCVPLEILVPDLIYTVLDLVPVLQVKQLVRLLGVKDTEIEQVEQDYRSRCREAHYQMLRVWAERSSQAGAMLHRTLLQQLLDKLRKMHLEHAAEELETKYGIQ